jgi:PKD repeat protein
MIKGGLVNANRNEYLTIHNAGHIMLTGDLEDRGKGLFQSSSFGNNSGNTEGAIDTVRPPINPGDNKTPRGHIYFIGNTPQTIRSMQDTSIWLAYVHVRNTVKLENSIRLLGVIDLHDSLDINGHDVYNYIYDNFNYTGNWGKWDNETNTTFVYDSRTDSSGAIRMLKSRKDDFDNFKTIGLIVATTEQNAKLSVVRRHIPDMGVTSGSIRKYFDVAAGEYLNPTDSLGITYFDRDFNPLEMSEADFSLFELRTDGATPKARRLQSELDAAQNRITSVDNMTYGGGMRYSVASIRCSDPPYLDLGADTVLCTGHTLTLRAPVAQHLPVHYEWKRENTILRTGNDSTFLLHEAGRYFVRATDSRGCETIDSINVWVAPNPQLVLHTNASRQCESAPFTFRYTNTSPVTVAQTLWDFGDHTASTDTSCTKSYDPLCSTYVVRLSVTSTEGCTATDSLTVTVEQRRKPQIRMSLNDTYGTFLAVDTLQNCLPDISVATWYVNGNSVATGEKLADYPFPNYGDYVVGLRWQGTLCSAYVQDTIHVKAPGVPRFTLPKRDYCAGEPVNPVNTSEANSGSFTYHWNYGNGRMSQDYEPLSIAYAEAGMYEVSLTMVSTSIKGWQRIYTDTVYVYANPRINFGDTVFHCKAQYTLRPEEVQPYYTYEWKLDDVAAGAAETLAATVDGNYSLLVTNTLYGCHSAENVQLLLNNHLRPQLGGDREVCGSLVLDAHNPNAEYLWSTGATAREITVAESGVYHVYVRDSEGCEGRDTVTIVIHEMPNADLGGDASLCDNETLTLHTPPNTAGAAYAWSNGATTETVAAASEGKYSVRVTHANGICTATDTIQLFGQQSPVITFDDDYRLCNGQDIQLSQQEHYYADIRWTYPDGQTATGTKINTRQSGVHTVYVRYDNGCSATGSVTVSAGETNAVANFMVASKANRNDMLQFINLSYPEPLSYRWEIESILFSVEENPVLTLYDGAVWMRDTFNVRLTVADGSCPVSKVKQIIILPDNMGVKMRDVETGEEVIIGEDAVITDAKYVDLLDAVLYPNPTATGQYTVTVRLTAPSNVRMVVFNLSGQIVDKKVFEMNEYRQVQFNTDGYAPGIYLLHVSAGSKTRLLKVLVEK